MSVLKSIISVVVINLIVLVTYGQQMPFSTHTANSLYANPALLPSNNKGFGAVNVFSQWVGMQGAPSVFDFAAGTSIKQMGTLALVGSNQTKGLYQNTDIKLAWGNLLQFNRNTKLHYGFAAGWAGAGINTAKIRSQNPEDIFEQASQSQNSAFSGSAGLVVTSANGFNAALALSELQLFANEPVSEINTAVSYRFFINTLNLPIEPGIRYQIHSLYGNRLRVQLATELNHILGITAFGGSDGLWGLSANIKINRIDIAYATGVTQGTLANVSAGSHQISLLYQNPIKLIAPQQNNNTLDSLLIVEADTIKADHSKKEIIRTKTRLISGKVLDSNTNHALNAYIHIIDNETNRIIATVKSDSITGLYEIDVPVGMNIGMAIESEGRMFHSENLQFNEADISDAKIAEVKLQALVPGTKIVLNNVFFRTGSSTPTALSYAEFDRIIKLMTENPNLRIKITGHTDNTGTKAINQTISTNRARAIVTYLTGKGIPRSRFEFEGLADSQPIASNAIEQGRDRNRRVEAEIVE